MLVLSIYVVIGLIAVHAVGLLRKDWRTLGAALVLDAVALGLITAGVADEARFETWMQEDGWVEWATFYAFAAAGAVTATTLWRSWRSSRAAPGPRWVLWLGLSGLTAFCVFVAMEEISWGQRIFGFQPPEAFLTANYQQELNLHNFLKDKALAGIDLDSRYLVALIALGYGVLLPVVATCARRVIRRRRTVLDLFPPLFLSPWFAGVALAEAMYPISYCGEACELFLGTLFVADALVRRGATDPALASGRIVLRRTGLALVGVAALAFVTGPALDLLVFGSDAERSDLARQELESVRRDLETGAARPKLAARNVHKRLYTAVQDGYLRPRDTWAPHRDRRGYFLDPWNNPYWIHHRKDTGRGVVYSFGPNRRRDSALADGGPLRGDDIGVIFSLARRDQRLSRSTTDER